ncbi:uncharacterized protein TNCV_2014531 [Trichonephila clavipes]|nr:uncharacterized protein TNCV_2014531 [Trichonephila clavipes]
MLCWLRYVSEGLVAFAVDRRRLDCCCSLCTARGTNEGRLELDTFQSENEHLSHHAKTIVIRCGTLNCNKTTMYYSIDMNFFYSKDNLVALHFKYDQARRRFVEWAQNEIAVVPDFHKRILFSDEAHFWLNGYVNEQNCRIWSEANPQCVETPLHPEKLTVWCALWAGGILLQKR